MSKRVNYRLEHSIVEMIKQIAQYEGISDTDVVRMSVQSIYASYRDDEPDTFSIGDFTEVPTNKTRFDFSYVQQNKDVCTVCTDKNDTLPLQKVASAGKPPAEKSIPDDVRAAWATARRYGKFSGTVAEFVEMGGRL